MLPRVHVVPAGSLRDGTVINAVRLTNAAGISAQILAYGATLQSLTARDINGKYADIVLGHDDVSGYEAERNFLGVTVGRYANRIAEGRFVLDGVAYQLPLNDGANALHGGVEGFDTKTWQIESTFAGECASVTLTHHSADGDSGYPGAVHARVTYALDNEGSLFITFEATTTRPTVLNMTNHALFNLAGEGSERGTRHHRLTIPAKSYTPVDKALIPTGDFKEVAGSIFDFTNVRVVGEARSGYDANFVLNKGLTAVPELAARLEDVDSGRVLEVFTTEPGLQLYTAFFPDRGIIGKRGHIYRTSDGIALEPQKFPDTPNRPAFGSARVDPDKPYRHQMIYRLSVRN